MSQRARTLRMRLMRAADKCTLDGLRRFVISSLGKTRALPCPRRPYSAACLISFSFFCCWLDLASISLAQDLVTKTAPNWNYSVDQMRPFWLGSVIEGETVLFIQQPTTQQIAAEVMFPILEVIAVRNSAGTVTFEEGKDFVWQAGSRQLTLPKGSRIVAQTAQDLRRPAKSQKHELTHRDGNGEIFFGSELQYAAMQTCITYRHAEVEGWQSIFPRFDPQALPQTVSRLVNRQPFTIVALGDSITAGMNASAMYNSPPYQPAYPELVRRHLAERFHNQIELINLAVSGTNTEWGISQIDKVISAKPQLVVLAFGMNDSASRSVESYRANTLTMINKIRKVLPDCEFVLVAPMLGNRDWTRLRHEVFPQYRDALAQLVSPGVALADLTTVWGKFLTLKKDWDLTGNGVNHPNDFGHRVYAQVITTLLDPMGQPDASSIPLNTAEAGPIKLSEQRLLGNYTYSYACAAADLDGDGDLDLTSADAEPNSNLYLLRNNANAGFSFSFIQKFQGNSKDPVRMERHAIGDINHDGAPDIVIVDNLLADIRWFENPGSGRLNSTWMVHRVVEAGELPGSYDVALADLDCDGDLDIAASSWKGERLDWFENVGKPGEGAQWSRHTVAEKLGETRTIAIADFNRDGRPDLLATARTTHRVMWFEQVPGDKSLTWLQHTIDDMTQIPAHGHPVDFDGDGDMDVVMAFGIAAPAESEPTRTHQVAWYENLDSPGNGHAWRKHSIASGFHQGFEAVAGDMDKDGDLDVVATGWSPAGRIAWLENPGDARGEWKTHVIKARWSNAVTVLVADMNADGWLDIVACAERGANELRWWRNEGLAK